MWQWLEGGRGVVVFVVLTGWIMRKVRSGVCKWHLDKHRITTDQFRARIGDAGLMLCRHSATII